MNRPILYAGGLVLAFCLAIAPYAEAGENGPFLQAPSVAGESLNGQTLPPANPAPGAPFDRAGRHLSRAWWHVHQAVQLAARPLATRPDDTAGNGGRSLTVRRPDGTPASTNASDAVRGVGLSRAESDAPDVSPEMAALRSRIRRVLAAYYRTPVNTQDHSPWEIMHWIVAFGVEAPVRRGGPEGDPITAIGWLCFNGRGGSQRLLYQTGQAFDLHHGPGVQGHSGQFLAILAQSRVMLDYPIRIGDSHFTVADLVEHEKRTCRSGTELTFKLIGLAHYLDFDDQWQSDSGGTWNVPKLVREEIAQPIRGAACGGTHRLMGLSYVVQKRAKRGEPVIGEYRRAATYVRDYHKYTFKLQNSDGSFSTEWFQGRGNRQDPARKLQTTGHILEWLVFSLPEQELLNRRTIDSVRFLCDLLEQHRRRRWRIGPLGHALRALVLYDQRAFGGTADDYLEPSDHDDQTLAVDGESPPTHSGHRR